jgi:hypothetical protein
MASKYTKGQYMQALQRDQGRGYAAEDEYYDRAREFDPQASVNRAAEGAMATIQRPMQRNLKQFRESQVAQGRFTTGNRFVEEDEIVARMHESVGNEIARNSLQATGMELRNNEGIGGYGERTSGRYLDLLSGQMDRETMEEEAAKQRKASRWGALAKLAGGVAGTVFGPVGAAAGSYLAGKLVPSD